MFVRSSALAVATISAVAVPVLPPTSAFAGRGAFDGNWNVQIAMLHGACPSDVGFAVNVRDGKHSDGQCMAALDDRFLRRHAARREIFHGCV